MELPEQLKNGHIFRQQLPHNIIKIINQYIYKPKNNSFIVKKMILITWTNPRPQTCWKLLIRDSKNVKIVPDPFSCRSNFATFIYHILEQWPQNLAILGPYFQFFCIQALYNNPYLIHNQYDVLGYGYIPAYSLLVSYLINRTIDKKSLQKCLQMQINVFNILKFVLENQYIQGVQGIEKLFYEFNLGKRVSGLTAQTVELLLSYTLKIDTNTEFLQNKLKRHNVFSLLYYQLKDFFISLFANYIQLRLDNICQELNRYLYQTSQQYYAQSSQIKPCMQKIIKILDKYPEVVQALSDLIIDGILITNSLKLVYLLMNFDTFKAVMMKQKFVFSVVKRGSVKWMELIWSSEQNRNKISKMKMGGKNVLQEACCSYGLLFNMISILWECGLFGKMPAIKNKKSQKIITNKYKL